jgi:hypothetical protein
MNLPGLHCSKHWACAEVDLYIEVATAARANKQHFIAKGCRKESGEGFVFANIYEFPRDASSQRERSGSYE